MAWLIVNPKTFMTENKDKAKKKKTLSLKLDSKPVITPRRNIEAGKTVIVEKKRVKRQNSTFCSKKTRFFYLVYIKTN